ncbi:hypothetical protein PFISCL1PPCAC_4512 [Pristionchus fissidentatus]|uniref:Uncharacterized protein n=1 Tax=Pristionchus fissidentatus TaxID=1538716 RepID=A0AAV5V5U3_9BILA|nr:hypothetical protein PFISCL1PPCAC_4512 [Pristionchus fissidentatus]
MEMRVAQLFALLLLCATSTTALQCYQGNVVVRGDRTLPPPVLRGCGGGADCCEIVTSHKPDGTTILNYGCKQCRQYLNGKQEIGDKDNAHCASAKGLCEYRGLE